MEERWFATRTLATRWWTVPVRGWSTYRLFHISLEKCIQTPIAIGKSEREKRTARRKLRISPCDIFHPPSLSSGRNKNVETTPSGLRTVLPEFYLLSKSLPICPSELSSLPSRVCRPTGERTYSLCESQSLCGVSVDFWIYWKVKSGAGPRQTSPPPSWEQPRCQSSLQLCKLHGEIRRDSSSCHASRWLVSSCCCTRRTNQRIVDNVNVVAMLRARERTFATLHRRKPNIQLAVQLITVETVCANGQHRSRASRTMPHGAWLAGAWNSIRKLTDKPLISRSSRRRSWRDSCQIVHAVCLCLSRNTDATSRLLVAQTTANVDIFRVGDIYSSNFHDLEELWRKKFGQIVSFIINTVYQL